MLRKLLSLIGLTTKSHMRKSMVALEDSHAERLQEDQKYYRETLDIMEKQYNDELTKLASENDELKRENDSLLEDVALALLKRKPKGTKSTVQVSKAKEIKHNYDPAIKIKPSAQQMIAKLEEKLKGIPDNARGTGGIDLIKNSKVVTEGFETKADLQKILKDAKAGKIEIAPQAGL